MAPPVNDAFADATVIPAAPYSVASPYTATEDTSEATVDAGGPSVGDGNNSVWFSYAPPRDGTVTVDTFGSDYDTILSIWTGPDLASLSLLTSNDDHGGVTSQVSFSAVADTTYYIMVESFDPGGGSLTLNLTAILPCPPSGPPVGVVRPSTLRTVYSDDFTSGDAIDDNYSAGMVSGFQEVITASDGGPGGTGWGMEGNPAITNDSARGQVQAAWPKTSRDGTPVGFTGAGRYFSIEADFDHRDAILTNVGSGFNLYVAFGLGRVADSQQNIQLNHASEAWISGGDGLRFTGLTLGWVDDGSDAGSEGSHRAASVITPNTTQHIKLEGLYSTLSGECVQSDGWIVVSVDGVEVFSITDVPVGNGGLWDYVWIGPLGRLSNLLIQTGDLDEGGGGEEDQTLSGDPASASWSAPETPDADAVLDGPDYDVVSADRFAPAWVRDGDVSGPRGGVTDGELAAFKGATGQRIEGTGLNVAEVATQDYVDTQIAASTPTLPGFFVPMQIGDEILQIDGQAMFTRFDP
jgi:hypothetical protein